MTRGPYVSRESMTVLLALSRLMDTEFAKYWAQLNGATVSKLARISTREGHRALTDEGRVRSGRSAASACSWAPAR